MRRAAPRSRGGRCRRSPWAATYAYAYAYAYTYKHTYAYA